MIMFSKMDVIKMWSVLDSPLNRLDEMVFAERLSRLTGEDYVKKQNEEFKRRDEKFREFLFSEW